MQSGNIKPLKFEDENDKLDSQEKCKKLNEKYKNFLFFEPYNSIHPNDTHNPDNLFSTEEQIIIAEYINLTHGNS
jgi:hypothetical protein